MNDMSGDEDTFLSAYMDGQLDSDQQQQVESALVASPELAENLRALAGVRELVAGLHRDACVDISPEVMRRIRGLSRSRSLLSPSRPWPAPVRRFTAVAAILTLAAGILLIVTVMVSLRPSGQGPQAAAHDVIDNVIAESGSGVDSASTNEPAVRIAHNPASSSAGTGPNHSAAPEAHALAGKPDGGAALASAGHSAQGDLELARRMLDNPSERRFFLIKNGADEKAQQHVASVVERTTRFGFFKITVTQGIVIDPRHPDEATVFAMLVNPKELGRLRDQLKEVLQPDAIEETPGDPKIVTQLADISHVQDFAPVLPGDVSISHEAMALRTRVVGADNAAQSALTFREKVSVRPTPEQYNSAPNSASTGSGAATEHEHATALAAADDLSRPPEAPASARAHLPDSISGGAVASSRSEPPADAAKSDEMILVFVWVCKSRPS
jgi:hypothetical protein